MKQKKMMSKMLVLALALVMVFTMTASAFATTNGTATVTIQYYDSDLGTSEVADSTAMSGVTLTSGMTLKAAIDAAFNTDERPYAPIWTNDVDYYTGAATKRLTSLIGCDETNVDHQYNADGSGWAKDWGWMYTVYGQQPVFSDNPNHAKMMDQYVIQANDNIVIKYVYVETAWDSTGATIYNIVHE